MDTEESEDIEELQPESSGEREGGQRRAEEMGMRRGSGDRVAGVRMRAGRAGGLLENLG